MPARSGPVYWPQAKQWGKAGGTGSGATTRTSGARRDLARAAEQRRHHASPGRPHADAGALPGGGQRASGAGRADGGAVGTPRRHDDARGLRFQRPVVPGGYAWWYLDALSDDGRHGLTLIAFVGSVFSPYYAWARRRGPVDPSNHCAINVALYGVAGKRWAMTERDRPALQRSTERLAVGRSILTIEPSVGQSLGASARMSGPRYLCPVLTQ